MAELIVVALLTLLLWAFSRMLRCPRCKTLKSVFLKKRKKIDVVEYKAEMHCSVCGHIWNRPFHGFGGGADGGG